MGWRGLREVGDGQLCTCLDRALGEDGEADESTHVNSSEVAVAEATVVNVAGSVTHSCGVDDEARLKLSEVEGGVWWFVADAMEEACPGDDLAGVLTDELASVEVCVSAEACAPV